MLLPGRGEELLIDWLWSSWLKRIFVSLGFLSVLTARDNEVTLSTIARVRDETCYQGE